MALSLQWCPWGESLSPPGPWKVYLPEDSKTTHWTLPLILPSRPRHLVCPKGVESVSLRGWLWDVSTQQGPGTWQTSKRLRQNQGTLWKLFMTLFLPLWEHDLLPAWPRISICLGWEEGAATRKRILQGTRGNSPFPTGIIGLGCKRWGLRSLKLEVDL